MSETPLQAGVESFFAYDPLSNGAKGLIWIGEKLLVYRRDGNNDKYPYCIDLPGGAPEGEETPFETCRREVMEEFGLVVARENLVDGGAFASTTEPGRTAYFFVVRFPEAAAEDIRFGDEGVEYMLMTPEEYFGRTDVSWPHLQARARGFVALEK